MTATNSDNRSTDSDVETMRQAVKDSVDDERRTEIQFERDAFDDTDSEVTN